MHTTNAFLIWTESHRPMIWWYVLLFIEIALCGEPHIIFGDQINLTYSPTQFHQLFLFLPETLPIGKTLQFCHPIQPHLLNSCFVSSWFNLRTFLTHTLYFWPWPYFWPWLYFWPCLIQHGCIPRPKKSIFSFCSTLSQLFRLPQLNKSGFQPFLHCQLVCHPSWSPFYFSNE